MIRAATPADAEVLGVLASHVYLHTYVPEGVNRVVANEVLALFRAEAIAARIGDPAMRVLVLEDGDGWMLGYAELALRPRPPLLALHGAEVHRLYLHPSHQGRGLGRQLLTAAEDLAREDGAKACWLTAWEGNTRALAFYPRQGYAEVGKTDHWIEGTAYPNIVFSKPL